MAKEIRNISASVRARLQNLSRETGQSFELLLTRYALERLLYRLSTSAYAERFVLKGAMLLTSWFKDPHRATRDLDLLGFGDPSPDAMVAAFREILEADVADGVEFDSDALRVDHNLGTPVCPLFYSSTAENETKLESIETCRA